MLLIFIMLLTLSLMIYLYLKFAVFFQHSVLQLIRICTNNSVLSKNWKNFNLLNKYEYFKRNSFLLYPHVNYIRKYKIYTIYKKYKKFQRI